MIELKDTEGGKGTNSYSFSLQYTSLMLIVLCFIVGAFTQERIKSFEPKVQQIVEENPKSEAVVFELFEEGKTNFTEDALGALDLLMASHDIDIELAISETEKGISNPELALARVVALHKHFEAIGIPARAMNISTVAALSKGQVQFTLKREEVEAAHG